MSWLKKAFTVMQPEPGAVYILTSPILFHEMRHCRIVPKGTKVSSKMPRSDFLTSGMVLASAIIPQSIIEQGVLKENATTDVSLKIGEIPTQAEIYERFVNLDKEFKRKLDDFKQICISQKYIFSKGKDPHLYRVTESTSISQPEAVVESYGSVEDIAQKTSEAHHLLSQRSQSKIGRAYEQADFRRVDNIHTLMRNPSMQLDSIKLSFLLDNADIKPETQKSMSWLNCYSSLDPDAKEMRHRMQEFRSLQWVRDFISPYVPS